MTEKYNVSKFKNINFNLQLSSFGLDPVEFG